MAVIMTVDLCFYSLLCLHTIAASESHVCLILVEHVSLITVVTFGSVFDHLCRKQSGCMFVVGCRGVYSLIYECRKVN